MGKISDRHKRMLEAIIGNIMKEVEDDVVVDILDGDGSVSIILVLPECEKNTTSK